MTDRRLVGRALAVAVSLSIAAAWAAGAGAQDASSAPASGGGDGLWSVYDRYLKGAKYIDLTHAFSPVQPVWPGFGNATFAPAKAGKNIEGYVGVGEEFLYGKHGFVASAYVLPTDQYGTQLDPPAHWDERGATISDLPPTFAVRPLVVINIAPKVASDEGYHLQVADIEAWEAEHGRVPEGSVVMVRSDWSKRWGDVARFNQKPFPGVSLDALKLLHLDRKILFHGHEPLDTDTTPTLEGEAWLLHNNFTQAEGVTNLDQFPEAGALITIGFAKPLGGTGGYARYVAIAPSDWPQGVTIAEAPGAPLPTQTAPLRRDANGVMRPTSQNYSRSAPAGICSRFTGIAGRDSQFSGAISRGGAMAWKSRRNHSSDLRGRVLAAVDGGGVAV